MCEMVIFSTFLEAKLRSAFVRESVEIPEFRLPGIGWTVPDRPLTNELAIALNARNSSGEILWHVVSALYVVEDPRQVLFATLDHKQESVAREIGFKIPEN